MRQTGTSFSDTSLEVFNPTDPADPKIFGGHLLHAPIDETDLEVVQFRLEQAFMEMRQDQTRGTGACLAYGFDVPRDDQEVIDEILLDTAKRQNHGMLTQDVLQGAHMLWEGLDGRRRFTLSKRVGPIILNNADMPDGVVYSLLSRQEIKRQTWSN